MRARLAHAILVAGGAAIAAGAPAAAGELTTAFDAHTARDARSLAPRWADVLDRTAAQKSRKPVACPPARVSTECGAAAWQHMLEKVRLRPPASRLAAVHAQVNRLPYVADIANWQRADYWETPAEMFARGGDCEDYALTKYFALRALGYDDAAMRLAIVWDRIDAEEHAVLLVRAGDTIWMLDNKLATPEAADVHEARYRLIYTVHQGGVRFAGNAPASRDIAAGAASARRVTFTVRPRRTSPGDAASPIPFAQRSPTALAALAPAPVDRTPIAARAAAPVAAPPATGAAARNNAPPAPAATPPSLAYRIFRRIAGWMALPLA